MESVKLLYEFSLVFGIVITAIILLLLGKKQPPKLHHRIILIFFIFVFILFLYHYAAYHQVYWLFVGTNLFTEGLGFLLGPLIYFYIISLFKKIDFKTLKVWLSFLPFFFFWVTIPLPIAFKNPKEGVVFDYLYFYFEYADYFYLLEIAFLLVFMVLSLNVLNKYSTSIKDYFSNWSIKDIEWSKRLLIGVIFYLLIDLSFILFENQLSTSSFLSNQINLLTSLLVVIYLGYYGFFQSQMLIPSFLLQQQVLPIPAKKNMIHFSKVEINHINQSIQAALAIDKLYLNETLTLSDLAAAVQLKDKKLSTFINQELATNFYELVNHHRIEAFKKEIKSTENTHLTIWGIASQCGFNSKASFNRIFKKQTGQTPSQYQKTLK